MGDYFGERAEEKGTSMRFYTQFHKHYCGVDLYARSM
jgi:hypothetical protein